jgi:hypothetical protein
MPGSLVFGNYDILIAELCASLDAISVDHKSQNTQMWDIL